MGGARRAPQPPTLRTTAKPRRSATAEKTQPHAAAYLSRGIDAASAAHDARVVHLHDLLMACAVCGLVLAGTYTTFEQSLRTQAVGVARAEAQQAARAALARLSIE